MKRFKITYKVKLKTWEERYLIVSAYTKSEAKDKFEMGRFNNRYKRDMKQTAVEWLAMGRI
jgi:hypothetical protein